MERDTRRGRVDPKVPRGPGWSNLYRVAATCPVFPKGHSVSTVQPVRRPPHENVATVLVDPAVLRDLELELMPLDLWVWPVESAPVFTDGPRMAFQIRRRLLMARRGEWDLAAEWTPVWISFGD